jgi:hypothetical protein
MALFQTFSKSSHSSHAKCPFLTTMITIFESWKTKFVKSYEIWIVIICNIVLRRFEALKTTNFLMYNEVFVDGWVTMNYQR